MRLEEYTKPLIEYSRGFAVLCSAMLGKRSLVVEREVCVDEANTRFSDISTTRQIYTFAIIMLH